MLVSLNIPWLYTLLHIGYHLKVLSTKKTAKVLWWARSKFLFSKHIKGMFGENLKSAMTGNYIWIRHMRADAVWFLATEKNCRSRVQGRNAALGPASLVPWFPADFLRVWDGSLLHLLMPPYRNLLKWNAILKLISFWTILLGWSFLIYQGSKNKPKPNPTQNIKWHKTQLLSTGIK